MYVYVYANIYVGNICMCVCVCVCMYICMYVCMYLHMQIYMWVSMNLYILHESLYPTDVGFMLTHIYKDSCLPTYIKIHACPHI